jgi:hypothetical protein
VTVSNATHRTENLYGAQPEDGRFIFFENEATPDEALALGVGLNVRESNIASLVTDEVTNEFLVAPGMSVATAVDAAAAGDTIMLASGSYSETSIILNKELTIKGANAGLVGSSGARLDESVLENTPFSISADGAIIDGVEIFQTNDAQNAVLLSGASTIQNSIIRRNGVNSGASSRGVVTANGTVDFEVSDNLFTGDISGGFFSGHTTWNSGIYVNGSGTSGDIMGNVFENCRTVMNLDDFNTSINITGNTLRTSGTFCAFGGTTPTDGQFTISGNELFLDFVDPVNNFLPTSLFNNSNVAATFRLDATGNTFAGIETANLTNVQKYIIESKTLHRGRSNRGGVVDFVSNEQVVVSGTTIQSAVDAAASGDTVLVSSGSFSGDVQISKELTLQGANEGVVGFATRDDESQIDGGIRIAAANVVVDGFKVNDVFAGSNPSAINVAASDVFILNTIVDSAAPSQSAIEVQAGPHNNLTATGNKLVSNYRGFYLNPASGHTISNNLIASNAAVGIGSDGQSNLTVTENVFTDNVLEGIGLSAVGSGVSITENNFTGNTDAIAHYGGESLDGTLNYWGGSTPANSGPFSPNNVNGGTSSELVAFSPWYADAARSVLVSAAPEEIDDDVTEENLVVPPGADSTVGKDGSLTVNGALELKEGSSLTVSGGSLTFGDGSTLSGSFTFFNSFGSVNINGNTTFSASAQGLILISEVHVADGTTITANGNLIIDGSSFDSPGSFNLVVAPSGQLTMARTGFDSGAVTLNSGDVKIYDSSFTNSTIAVASGVVGAEIYHNLTDDLGWLTDAGTDTVTTVGTYGNFTDMADTNNNLLLGLDIGSLDADRTQDGQGNVFVQSGDLVTTSLDVSELTDSIVAIESLLGYDTDFLSLPAGLTPATDWNDVIVNDQNTSTTIGKLDSTLGYQAGQSSGSDVDQQILSGAFTAQAEGETFVFHRVSTESGSFPDTTLLTSGGSSPEFLVPFTSNSSMVIIDDTDPLIAAASSVEQDSVDKTPFGEITVQGGLEIAAAAFDALAGIDDIDAVLTLESTSTATTYTATQGATSTVDVSGTDYTQYDFTYPVVATTENGTYDVVFTVTDRSGNVASQNLGAVEINKNQIVLDIELEGLAPGPLTRDVVLITTDGSGGVIEARTESIEFTSGVGQVTLTNVLGTPVNLSAKTAWNLRKRLASGLNSDGQASVEMLGTDFLFGGDFNDDNFVNTLDYAILRFHYNSTADPTADATGDGSVNLTDYNQLKTNFYTAGDAL